MVFDEIDAGIGGTTAHAVGETLRRLAERAQVRHDHPPAADRERRRPPLPRREGPRRPDAHADRAARRRRAPRRARADARRRRVPRHARRGECADGEPRAARAARGRLGVPRRAVPPLRLVARDHRRRAGPARLRARRALEGAGVQRRTSSSGGASVETHAARRARSSPTSAGRGICSSRRPHRRRGPPPRPESRPSRHASVTRRRPSRPTLRRARARRSGCYDLVQTAAHSSRRSTVPADGPPRIAASDRGGRTGRMEFRELFTERRA